MRRPWSEKEDQAITNLVDQFGLKSWNIISQKLVDEFQFAKRTGKQCRERWYNHLDPNVSKNDWTKEEEEIFEQQHKLVGNCWAKIAKHLPGRTDNAIKNHYYSYLRKMQRKKNKSGKSKNLNKKILSLPQKTTQVQTQSQTESLNINLTQHEETLKLSKQDEQQQEKAIQQVEQVVCQQQLFDSQISNKVLQENQSSIKSAFTPFQRNKCQTNQIERVQQIQNANQKEFKVDNQQLAFQWNESQNNLWSQQGEVYSDYTHPSQYGSWNQEQYNPYNQQLLRYQGNYGNFEYSKY